MTMDLKSQQLRTMRYVQSVVSYFGVECLSFWAAWISREGLLAAWQASSGRLLIGVRGGSIDRKNRKRQRFFRSPTKNTYKCILLCVYMYIYIYIHTYTYTYMYACMYIYIY